MVIDTQLANVIAEHFSIEKDLVKPDSGPQKGDIELWDSFGHITLILRIESAFSVKFKAAEIPELSTPALIQKKLSELGAI